MEARLPRTREFDGTLALKREGYLFISNRCRALGTDAFRTRLMLHPVVCLRGAEAAAFFYGGSDRMTRRRALPPQTLRLLQDRQGAQQLDGAAHRHRKALFMALAGPDEAARLAALFAEEWQRALPAWRAAGRIVLMDEARLLLCRAVCAWAGLSLSEDDLKARSRDFGAMVDGSGAIGLRALRGLALRARCESWARGVIRTLRERGDRASPAGRIAHFEDEDGTRLDVGTAAVELLNLLRPVCAVDRFIAFAAHALHHNPVWRRKLSEPVAADCFVQEVRRLYPFFPAVGGRLLRDAEWRGIPFRRGDWLLLDLYGTNHDTRLWRDPHLFRPERCVDWDSDPNTLVPQGAGEAARDHRCPGEGFAIELMKVAVEKLAELDAPFPPQDWSIDLARFPAEPRDRAVVEVR